MRDGDVVPIQAHHAARRAFLDRRVKRNKPLHNSVTAWGKLVAAKVSVQIAEQINSADLFDWLWLKLPDDAPVGMVVYVNKLAMPIVENAQADAKRDHPGKSGVTFKTETYDVTWKRTAAGFG